MSSVVVHCDGVAVLEEVFLQFDRVDARQCVDLLYKHFRIREVERRVQPYDLDPRQLGDLYNTVGFISSICLNITCTATS